MFRCTSQDCGLCSDEAVRIRPKEMYRTTFSAQQSGCKVTRFSHVTQQQVLPTQRTLFFLFIIPYRVFSVAYRVSPLWNRD